MINFRQKKKGVVKDMMPDAIRMLDSGNIPYKSIKLSDADSVSQVNSKAMVIRELILAENGNYRIKVQDKAAYNYTEKLLGKTFGLEITDVDKKNRIITAESENLGIILDAIEIMGWKYNLSIVK